MDQPAHCGSLQRARRHGASLAQRVRARRCRGVEGDRGARPATGKDRSRAACRRASARSSRRRPAQLDDPAPHGRDRGARGRQDRQVAVVQGVAKKNFRWRRPRHTLKGRQIAAEIERVGLRLQLRKAQAEAGDIILLYGDESEALTHPYLARAWALRGANLRAPAPGQAKKVAIIGSLDHVTRQLIVHTSQTKRSRDFIAHLEQLDPLFGPQPGRAIKPVVLSRTTGRSMSASSLVKPSRRANTGSPSSGCQNTHPNSTTSRLSGTISRRAIWPIRPSLMPTPSTAQSTQPWLP